MAKIFIGKVVSTKMQKTLVVAVQRERAHPLYKKLVRSSKRFKVHNENAEIKVGDSVKIGEIRPMSSQKRWKVLEVVKK